ncbi:MAG TPA: SDR family oxidoreductase [Acidimicrobiales bacterium]|nr:SDR family oxidoreductase [Acidimicrobiales bacterium]
MGSLDGRVAIITGAGRGLGREHALLFAAEGAKVVVNDLGEVAEETAAEVRATGGDAIASNHDITAWDGGQALVGAALEGFGRLDVLVNNAGILRDRMLVSMSEEEWDVVVDVHLKGHFVPTRFAAAHWREQVKAGHDVKASIIHTSSTSGLLGNPGQTNYGAAKAGIGAFSIICAQELARYGVRSNCIAPAARTRLTEATPGLGEVVAAPSEGFDVWDPANVAPLVAHLAGADCDVTGRTFFVQGGTVRLLEPWRMGERLEHDGRWSIDDLAAQLPKILS